MAQPVFTVASVRCLQEPLYMKGGAESVLGPFRVSIAKAWERLAERKRWRQREEDYEAFFTEQRKCSILDVDKDCLLSQQKTPELVKSLRAFRSFVITNGPCTTRPHVEERLIAGCCIGRNGIKRFRLWKRSPYLKDGISTSGRAPDFEYTLEPNDVLWIPSGWWHEVETLSERALLDGFVFEDDNTLHNLQRQIRSIYTFMRKGGVYNDDIARIAVKSGVNPSVRSLKRSKSGYSTMKTAAIADMMSRAHAKEIGGNKQRDASGQKRRKRIV